MNHRQPWDEGIERLYSQLLDRLAREGVAARTGMALGLAARLMEYAASDLAIRAELLDTSRLILLAAEVEEVARRAMFRCPTRWH